MELFGSSGTRGVVGEDFTPTYVIRVAAAAGVVLGAERVAVGRDTRMTGRMVADAAASGLASVGVDVDRLGIVPTPGIQAHATREGVPALIVTASHNPPEYNGIKVIDEEGIEAPIETLEAIEDRVLGEAALDVAWHQVGETRRIEGIRDAYVEEVVAGVDREVVDAAALTVALDPGHGAGSLTSPVALRRLGCRVLTLNAQTDGRFPGRNPEPIEANLEGLKRLVQASDADLGVAHDGDADRATFVDETGTFVSGDALLAALAADVLGPSDVTVAAVTVSQRLVDVVADTGAELELTRVGSTFIVQRIRELLASGRDVPIAGEGNGGIYVPPFGLRRDGGFLAARVLELVADRGETLSSIVAPFDEYENVRHDLEYETSAERAAMAEAIEALATEAAEEGGDDVDVTRTDGVRIDYGDVWLLARPSGTEPLFRVYAEGRAGGRAETVADRARSSLVAARDSA